MLWTDDKIKKLLQEIDKKAAVDLDFRNLCLTDPYKAIQQISGEEVPKEFNIRFIDNEGYHLTHILPDFMPPTGEELSDEELEKFSAAGLFIRHKCKICGSTNLSTLHIIQDPERFRVGYKGYRCNNCGHTSESYFD